MSFEEWYEQEVHGEGAATHGQLQELLQKAWEAGVEHGRGALMYELGWTE